MKTSRVSSLLGALFVLGWSASAHAYASAEILTTESYQYGRFEASIKFPSGSGVVGSFFLWKDGSEVEGTFWNELDFEMLGIDCHLETNAYYGNPAQYHVEQEAGASQCGAFHTFAYEWTPDYISFLVDGVEVRRETGDTAAAYRDNATEGMQIRFNLWPGDESFGGTFDPGLLPVYQDIDWVQYSSYDGADFVLEWREDFDDGAIPEGWELATWDSPKGLSTHAVENGGVVDGTLVLALTADDATGIPGVDPTTTSTGGAGGTATVTGTDTTGGTAVGGSGGSTATGGATDTATGTTSSTGTSTGASSVGGATGTGDATGVGGATATGSATDASGVTGVTGVGGGAANAAASSVSGATSNVTGTATGAAAPTTAATTTSGVTGGTAALGGTSDTGGGAADAADDSGGCACRTAGYDPTSGFSRNLAAVALLALGAALRFRRQGKR